ncbi:MAG TPA: FtsX-like permease family protein [Acidobacteriaceae bacterium]|nr:FtsX-like permease family protein [Acidobacteriaceae bacterium]
MLNKLILANLSHRPVRTLLSVLAIAVEVTMILTLVGVSHGTLDSTAARARGVGADIVIRPPNSSVMSSLNSAPISDKYVAWLASQPHVTVATGTAVQSLTFPDSITGIDFPTFNQMNGGFTYLHGGDPQTDNDIAVDEYYADQKHLHVGDPLKLVNHTWRVSGIYEGGKLARITVKLSALQAIMPGGEGHVTVIYGKLDDPKLTPQVVASVKKQLGNFPVYSMEELASMYSISNIGMLKVFIDVVIGVAVIVGFIVVFMAMYTAVLERTREIGIIKAVGGGPGLVLQILLRETLLLAILGTVVGILMTFGTKWIMRHTVPASLVQETVYIWWIYAGLIAIVGALLGAVVPGYKAVHQDVTEALSYE